ncbi:putative helicase mot1, partial [Neolecta irregularis DAH-3]
MMKRKAKLDARAGPTKYAGLFALLTPRHRALDRKPDSALAPPNCPDTGTTPAPERFTATPQPQSARVVVAQHHHQHPPLTADTGTRWPFEGLLDILLVDLFDPRWEIRHGAALGLRQLLHKHADGGGRVLGCSALQNSLNNTRWKQDLVCRLCCLFALDRFGDYIADTVVAPIRESAAQALAALFAHLDLASIRLTYNVLAALALQHGGAPKIWEASHGGLLGLKYLVAVRRDIVLADDALLDGIVHAVVSGLADGDDDVRSVSAATLVPVADEFVRQRPDAVDGLMDVVWECLAEIKDDLSASTGTVMDLLAKLCSFPQVLDSMQLKADLDPQYSFRARIPRLYPFLRHTIASVRSAVLRALLTFIDMRGDAWIDGKILRLIYQNILLETNDNISELSLEVWSALVRSSSQNSSPRFLQALMPHIEPLFTLLLTQISGPRTPEPLDATLLLRPTGQVYQIPKPFSLQSPSSEPPKKRRKNTKIDLAPHTHNIDAPMIHGDIELVGLGAVLRARISAAIAMGRAIAMFPEPDAFRIFENF